MRYNIKAEVVVWEKTATLNLRVNPDVMTATELQDKLDKGYTDIEKGNVVDAASAFAEFRERH